MSIFVSGIDFSVRRKELQTLFCRYGKIKSLRYLDRKGFAFVDYINESEAILAMKELNGNFIFGRKLIIDWAKGYMKKGSQKKKKTTLITSRKVTIDYEDEEPKHIVKSPRIISTNRKLSSKSSKYPRKPKPRRKRVKKVIKNPFEEDNEILRNILKEKTIVIEGLKTQNTEKDQKISELKEQNEKLSSSLLSVLSAPPLETTITKPSENNYNNSYHVLPPPPQIFKVVERKNIIIQNLEKMIEELIWKSKLFRPQLQPQTSSTLSGKKRKRMDEFVVEDNHIDKRRKIDNHSSKKQQEE